jgi:hypothetical protein
MGRLVQIRDPDTFEEPIWQRQVALGETNEYYTMFLEFCNIRPTVRSVANCWRERTLGTPHEGKGPSSTYCQLAQAFHWAERAAARDVQELRDKYTKWGERDWDWREQDYHIGEQLRKQAMKALKKIEEVNDKPDNTMVPDIQVVLSMLQMASTIQKGSIPNIGALTSVQVQDILAALPDAKRKKVLRIVMAEYRDAEEPKSDDSDIIEGVATVVQPLQLAGRGKGRGKKASLGTDA